MSTSNGNGGSNVPGGQSTAPLDAAADKQWAAAAHFAGVLSIIPPVIVWLIFRDRGRLTNQEGKESVNFQITMLVAWIALIFVSFLVAFIPFIGGLLSWVAYLVVFAGQVGLPILAGIRVSQGGAYRYPLCIRFIH